MSNIMILLLRLIGFLLSPSLRINCGVSVVFVFDTRWHNVCHAWQSASIAASVTWHCDTASRAIVWPPPPIVSLMTIVMANMSWWKYSRSFLTITEDSPWGANAVMMNTLTVSNWILRCNGSFICPMLEQWNGNST